MFLEKDYEAIRPPVIRLEQGSQAIILSENLKYLGLLFDRKMNFSAHIRLVSAKMAEIANKTFNIAKKHMGAKAYS